MLDKELLKTLNIANSYIKNPKIYKNIMAAQKLQSTFKDQMDIIERVKPQISAATSINFSAIDSLKKNISALDCIREQLNNYDKIKQKVSVDFNSTVKPKIEIPIENEIDFSKDIVNNVSKPEISEIFNTLVEANNKIIEALIESNQNSLNQQKILTNMLETTNKQFQNNLQQALDSQKFNNKLFYLGLATLAATIVIPILISILTSKGYL